MSNDKTKEQTAADESIGVINATPEEQKQNSLRSEMADARHDFPTPADYNKYVTALSQGLAGSPLLPEITVYNSQGFQTLDSQSGNVSSADAKRSQDAANDAKALKALYAIESVMPDFVSKLDTYSIDSKHNYDPRKWFGKAMGPDGNVGDEDLFAYIDDIQNEQGRAKADIENLSEKDLKILKENLQVLKDTDKDSISSGTIGSLESDLGITGDNRRQQFETVYGAVDASRPQVQAPLSSQENVENGVIHRYGNGSGRGFHMDPNGQLDAINQTNKDGMLTEYRKNPDGTWTQRTQKPGEQWSPVTPWDGKAPFLDNDGNFGFYVQDPADPNNPNKLRKVIFDKNGNNTLAPDNPTAAVDLAGTNPDGTPVAITGLNRTETLGAGQTGTIGALPVTYADGYRQLPGAPVDGANPNRPNTHAEYTIENGTNLTEIARKILHVQPGQPDPQNLQVIIDQLAKTNGYADPNLIPAGAQLVVPVDVAR